MSLLVVLAMWLAMDLLCTYRYKFCKRDCINVVKCKNWMCKKYSKYKKDQYFLDIKYGGIIYVI